MVLLMMVFQWCAKSPDFSAQNGQDCRFMREVMADESLLLQRHHQFCCRFWLRLTCDHNLGFQVNPMILASEIVANNALTTLCESQTKTWSLTQNLLVLKTGGKWVEMLQKMVKSHDPH